MSENQAGTRGVYRYVCALLRQPNSLDHSASSRTVGINSVALDETSCLLQQLRRSRLSRRTGVGAGHEPGKEDLFVLSRAEGRNGGEVSRLLTQMLGQGAVEPRAAIGSAA